MLPAGAFLAKSDELVGKSRALPAGAAQLGAGGKKCHVIDNTGDVFVYRSLTARKSILSAVGCISFIT